MTSLLMCCKTHQSVIEKSAVIARDTTTINRVVAKDSTSINAKIDSIIIEEYAVDRSELTTDGQDFRNLHGNKKNFHGNKKKLHGNKKRNDTSQTESIPPKRKTKIYGVNISGTWLSINDSLNKKMTHQETTKSEIKKKNPIQTTAKSKITYVLVGITLLLFAGYLYWKNAVQ